MAAVTKCARRPPGVLPRGLNCSERYCGLSPQFAPAAGGSAQHWSPEAFNLTSATCTDVCAANVSVHIDPRRYRKTRWGRRWRGIVIWPSHGVCGGEREARDGNKP